MKKIAALVSLIIVSALAVFGYFILCEKIFFNAPVSIANPAVKNGPTLWDKRLQSFLNNFEEESSNWKKIRKYSYESNIWKLTKRIKDSGSEENQKALDYLQKVFSEKNANLESFCSDFYPTAEVIADLTTKKCMLNKSYSRLEIDTVKFAGFLAGKAFSDGYPKLGTRICLSIFVLGQVWIRGHEGWTTSIPAVLGKIYCQIALNEIANAIYNKTIKKPDLEALINKFKEMKPTLFSWKDIIKGELEFAIFIDQQTRKKLGFLYYHLPTIWYGKPEKFYKRLYQASIDMPEKMDEEALDKYQSLWNFENVSGIHPLNKMITPNLRGIPFSWAATDFKISLLPFIPNLTKRIFQKPILPLERGDLINMKLPRDPFTGKVLDFTQSKEGDLTLSWPDIKGNSTILELN